MNGVRLSLVVLPFAFLGVACGYEPEGFPHEEQIEHDCEYEYVDAGDDSATAYVNERCW